MNTDVLMVGGGASEIENPIDLKLDSCTKTDLPNNLTSALWITGWIRDEQVTVIMDTGSGINLIGVNMVNHLELDDFVESCTSLPNVVVANGDSMDIVGKVSVSLKLGEIHYPVEFYVARSFGMNILLGNEFLQKNWATITFGEQPGNVKVMINGHLVPASVYKKQGKKSLLDGGDHCTSTIRDGYEYSVELSLTWICGNCRIYTM